MTRNADAGNHFAAPPPGVPSLLKLGEVAAVLNMRERTVKVWLERGALAYVQPTGRSGARLVRSVTVAEFAAQCGLVPDWGAVALA